MQVAPQRSSTTRKEDDDNLKTQKAILNQLVELTRLFKKKQRRGNDVEEDAEEKLQSIASITVNVATTACDIENTSPQLPLPAPVEVPIDDIDNPDWISHSEQLGNGKIDVLSEKERNFWVKFISKYLKPLDKDKQGEEEMKKKLLELRTSSTMAFWFLNLLWVLLSLLLVRDNHLNTVSFTIAGTEMKTQPFGFVFLLLFFLILILQLVSIVIHRWGTFLQLISITEIKRPKWMKQNVLENGKAKPTPTEAREIVDEFLHCRPFEEPAQDYNHNNVRSVKHSPSDIYRTLRFHSQFYSGRRRPSPDEITGRIEPHHYERRPEGRDSPNDEEKKNYRRGASDYRNRRYARGGEFERNFRRSFGTAMQNRDIYEAEMNAQKRY